MRVSLPLPFEQNRSSLKIITMKLRSFFFVPVLWNLQVDAQKIIGARIPLPGEEKEILVELKSSKPGINEIESMLKLSAYYLYLPGEEKEDLDRSMSYAKLAKEQSLRLNYEDGYNESLVLIGNTLDEGGQSDLANPVFDTAIQHIQNLSQKSELLNQPAREIRSLFQLARIYITRSSFEFAEKTLKEALNICQARRFTHLHYTYQRISFLYMLKGDINMALYYALEVLKSMEATGDYSSAGSFYYDIGFIYRQIGQFQKGIDYFEMAYNFYKRKPSCIIFPLATAIAEAMTKLNRGQDGISQLLNKTKQYPPTKIFEKREVEWSLGTCYRVIKKYDSAEVHFLRLLELQRKDRPNEIILDTKALGQLYVECGQYSKAKPYLDKCLAAGFFTGRGLSHLYFLLFKVDSAAGNYLLAIDHIMKNKEIDEELYKQAKIRENRELQIKYETEKKDKNLKIKGQNILLLTRLSQLQQKNIQQAELKFQFDSLSKDQNIKLLNAESAKKDRDLLLKQQSIDLLAKQDQLKQAKLEQTTTMKNVTIAGLVLLFIILALLYNQYRLKQKANREISEKNQSLQHLVDEKEWLLKEVHHRVKNNLHTVISLLETQSAYLKDDALAAVKNSQHRVYAMSLIHQKLYQLENSTNINMSVYLPELIDYLCDSFDVHQRIRFRSDIESIQLDISKAIPVGLILNEAITNSIKYAFPGNAYGEIQIEMKRTDSNLINLSVKDNGIGLPFDWEKIQKNSLGLKLMKGLSEDIYGKFSIERIHGTKIDVEFPGELVVKESKKKENIQIEELVS